MSDAFIDGCPAWMLMYIGKDMPPFNGRDFDKDLAWLTALVMEVRMRGAKSRDLEGRLHPFLPDTGWLHAQLDAAEGFVNHDTAEEGREFVARRHAWVLKLREALKVTFQAQP